MANTLTPTAPVCPRCHKPHQPLVHCWNGRYCEDITAQVLTSQGRTCWLCGKPGATTADHVVPRSMGGTDHASNLRPAHKTCNSRRQNGDPFPADKPTPPSGVPLSERWAR